MKVKRILIGIIVFVLILGSFTSQSQIIKADDETIVPGDEPKIKVVEKMKVYTVSAGETFEVTVPVKAVNHFLQNPYVTPVLKDLPFELVSEVSMTWKNSTVTNIDTSEVTYITFSLKVNDTAKSGNYDIYLNIVGFYGFNKQYDIKTTVPVVVQIAGEKQEASLSIENVDYSGPVKANKEFDLSLTIRNDGALTAKNVAVSIEGFTADGVMPNYSKEKISVGNITGHNTKDIKYSLKVTKEAITGMKTLTVKCSYTNSAGEQKTDSSNVYIDVVGKDKADTEETTKGPSFLITNTVQSPDIPVAGGEVELTFTLENQGTIDAKDVKIIPTNLSNKNFSPSGSKPYRYVKRIKAGEAVTLTMGFTVSKDVESGLNEIAVQIAYRDKNNKEYTPVETKFFVLNVKGKKKKDEKDKAIKEPSLLIDNTTQSPSSPSAGGRVELRFTLENEGKMDAREVKIIPTNLSNTNFSPVGSRPYQYIEQIKTGEKVNLAMDFTVSKKVEEGLNEIAVKIEYKDNKGKSYTPIETKFFVLDVQAKKEDDSGVPKLIISNYSAGKKEVLKAGEVFDFKFDIYNTHSHLSANNIKVTLSAEENVFSVAKGSNSFYINSIGAGQTLGKGIQLKVKNDCVTKSYPLKIEFEYEYKGMQKPKDTISAGLKVEEILNIQVEENARPTISNIALGGFDPLQKDIPNSLTFDFYNLGNSTLKNVTAKVKSKDFVPTSELLFIGNIEAGKGDSQEIEITPTIEGMEGKGKLIIFYEDSNGETIEVPTEFTAMVNPAIDFGEDMGENMGMELPGTKEPIVKLWIFIAIQIAIFILAIPISRKVIISIYKKRLLKKEQEEI